MKPALAILLSLSACVSVEEAADTGFACPPLASFGEVSGVLEQKCATLDCHGAKQRTLLLYGRTGRRLPGNVTSYDVATTDQEVQANYASVCGIEPEVMRDVVAGDASPGDLTIVRKYRLEETHKGGRVFPKATAGDRCVVGWLTNAPDSAACRAALREP